MSMKNREKTVTRNEHEYFMGLALEQAQTNGANVPVGAVVVCNGEVIASAANGDPNLEPFAHAEILAMKQAGKVLGCGRLKDCTLYVTLEPCPMCAGAMLNARLKACCFGAYDSAYGCCGSVYHLPADPAFRHYVKCTGGVLQKECEEVLTNYFALRHRGKCGIIRAREENGAGGEETKVNVIKEMRTDE